MTTTVCNAFWELITLDGNFPNLLMSRASTPDATDNSWTPSTWPSLPFDLLRTYHHLQLAFTPRFEIKQDSPAHVVNTQTDLSTLSCACFTSLLFWFISPGPIRVSMVKCCRSWLTLDWSSRRSWSSFDKPLPSTPALFVCLIPLVSCYDLALARQAGYSNLYSRNPQDPNSRNAGLPSPSTPNGP